MNHTVCDSPDYGLKSNVTVFCWVENESGELVEDVGAYFPGTTTVKASSTSGYVAFSIIKISCAHYINGINAYTTTVPAG